jgi:high-affinity K+ transport system ATPase subunit B
MILCVCISENWDIGLAREALHKAQEELFWSINSTSKEEQTALLAKRDDAVAALLQILEGSSSVTESHIASGNRPPVVFS